MRSPGLGWMLLLLVLTSSESLAAETLPKRTTLSDPSIDYRVPEKPYAVLRRADVEAVVVDNRAVDDHVLPGHRAGYSGVRRSTIANSSNRCSRGGVERPGRGAVALFR